MTTFAEGTFYSEGLQTTAQQLDFGASPAGAKGTFVQTNKQTVSYTTTATNVSSYSVVSPYDPVAQTFIIDPTNYPNGAFLSSARFFFSSKPSSDSSPVTLSIVGTLNGYPNGQTLDHSIVTLTLDKVKVSQNPQYLDSTTYTEFNFQLLCIFNLVYCIHLYLNQIQMNIIYGLHQMVILRYHLLLRTIQQIQHRLTLLRSQLHLMLVGCSYPRMHRHGLRIKIKV